MKAMLWGCLVLTLGSMGCLDSWGGLESKPEPATSPKYKPTPTFQLDQTPPPAVKEDSITLENTYEKTEQLEEEISHAEKAPVLPAVQTTSEPR